MAFTRKCIDVGLQLAQGNFVGGGNGAYLTGLRVSVAIDQPGSPDMAKALVAVYGLPLQLMNQLTTMPSDLAAVGKNFITIYAYEEGSTPAITFKGTITAAYVDARAQPQVPFRVDALAGLYAAVAPATPTTAPGSQDVSKMMGQVAQKAGLTLEDGGVSVKVVNPYLPNSPRQQINRLARAAGINWLIEGETLAIWPRGQARQGLSTTISPQTGMRGYPSFTAGGIEVTCLYNPSIKFGCPIQVQSDLTPACGTWYVNNVTHDLESETPGGKWFTTVSASKVKV